MMGHNIDEKAKKIITEYSESLSRSAEENDTRKELREKWEELGHDTKALQDGISRSKKSLKLREGYDESMAYFNKLHEEIGGSESLFSWVVKRDEEKQNERDAKKAEREKQKAKDDEYKPAAERRPKAGKVVFGKDAAAGEKADDEHSVGEQQAAAYQAAHVTTETFQ